MQVATPDAAQARALAQVPPAGRKQGPGVTARTKLVGTLSLPLLLISALAGLATSGCYLPPPVKPWQRVHLTRRALTFDDGLESRFKQHMFGAREGADGGYGKAGGGCGCN